MQGLWVTVLLVALYSTTKAQVDANKNWTEDKAFCMGRTNRTFYDDVPKFYRLTDDSDNCSTINLGDWTRAKIHNEFENCMAIRTGIENSISDFVIDLAKSDCNVSNGFAGNDFSEYFPRNQNKTCVRLRMNESDVVIVDGRIGYNNATWIFYDCNDINSVLCESLADNTTNTTETPDADNGNFSFPGNCSISDAITDNGSESTGDSNSGSSDGGGGGDDGGDSGSVGGGDSASKPAVVETTSVSTETNPPPRTSATRTMTTIPTTATTTTTTAAFAVSPTTVSATSFPASTATAAEIQPCEPNEEAEAGIGSALGSPTIDEEKLESSLKLIAFAKNVSCKAQYNDTELRTEIVVSGETTPQIPLDSYRLDGAHFPDGQDSAHKIVMAEFTVDRDVGESYVNDKQIYVDNRRTSFKFPSPSKLFAFTAYDAVTGEAVQTGQFSFSYKLDGDDTILDNAKRLTFDTDDANPLGTHHITKQWGVTCAFIDSTSQKFDGSGCSCVMENKTARCTSTHNSVFSVLFTIESVAVPAAVKAMTIVTETISVFFLVLTFVILIRVRRKVRGERIAVQINLVVSLTFLHFWSLLHDVALQSPAFCEAVAVLVHFFLLSSGVWMSVEAFLLYLKTSRWAFIKLKRKKVVIWSMTIGWGLPALICILTAAIGFPLQRYMQVSSLYRDIKEGYNTTRSATVLSSIYKYDMCWLSPDSGIRWAAIAPIILVLVINTAIAGKVAYFVHCKSDEAKNFKPTQQAANKDMVNIQFLNVLKAPLKAVSLLLPILGIPWILMFCSNATNVTARSAFMYVNAIVNGLQGVFVFLVYVVVGKEVRSATVKTLSSLTSSWQSFGDSHELRRKKSDQSDFSTLPKNSVLPIKSTEYTERPRSGGSQQGFV